MKQVWQEQEAPRTKGLNEIIGKRSSSPIAKMKRNLIIELIFVCLGFGSIIIYYLLEFQGRFQVISWVYGAMSVLFFVYFYFKYKLLHQMECMSCQVKSNLSRQVATLEKFTHFYLIAGTAAIPLVIVFFYFFETIYFPKGKGLFLHPSESTTTLRSLISLLLILVLSTVPMYFLNKWYIRKLYGKQIERLKQMLEQMEQD